MKTLTHCVSLAKLPLMPSLSEFLLAVTLGIFSDVTISKEGDNEIVPFITASEASVAFY